VFPLRLCFPSGVLIAACLAAYSNVYGNAFLFDDLDAIAANKLLLTWNFLGTI
jgi:hypothetical protein